MRFTRLFETTLAIAMAAAGLMILATTNGSHAAAAAVIVPPPTAATPNVSVVAANACVGISYASLFNKTNSVSNSIDKATMAQNPSLEGATFIGNEPVVIYAHEGVPTINGWVAPRAGFAYQTGNTVIYGVDNATPINYNGRMNEVIGMKHIGVSITNQDGVNVTDIDRMSFGGDEQTTRVSKAFPSHVNLKQGETLHIEGAEPIDCPAPGKTEQVSFVTGSGVHNLTVGRAV